MIEQDKVVFEDTTATRREIIEACRVLQRERHFIGTWGNISLRLEDGLLITPSRVDYAVMQPDDLVVVSWTGAKSKGSRVPSSELELHRLVMLQRKDLGALIHTHSPYAMTIASTHREIPVITEEMSQIIGGKVRCTRYIPAGRHLQFAEEACEKIGSVNAVLIANHGALVGGTDIKTALLTADILEKIAFIMINAASLGGSTEIPSELVGEERHRFLFKYSRTGL
jgi:L-ribulose-5-phosphate 4-epimerase